MRLRSRFAASRQRSSAISFERRLSCEVRRAFGSKEAVARARCVVAEAEMALVSCDQGDPDLRCTADVEPLTHPAG